MAPTGNFWRCSWPSGPGHLRPGACTYRRVQQHDSYTEAQVIRTLAKLVAYKKAPAKTFAVLHPVKAVKWGAIAFLVSKLIGRRQTT